VWLVRNVHRNEWAAIKAVERAPSYRDGASGGDDGELTEGHIMNQFRHPSILPLLDFRCFPGGVEILVVELMPDGDLFDRLRDDTTT
jgi:serine/threonine protein kinase